LIADGASFISEVAQSGFSLDMALDAVGGVGGRNRSRGKHHDESSERPAGSCETGNSFDPNTLVLMADGSRKPIKDVKLGDKVLATDPTTGKSAAREVTDVRSHASQRMLVEVTIGTGSVVATDEHPFWVASGKRWSHAIDLKPGHKLATPDNRDATITATKSWSESRRVYNLTIDTDHTYHVLAGTTPILVHNEDAGQVSCGTTDPLKAFADRNRNVSRVKFASEFITADGREYYDHNRHGRLKAPELQKFFDENGHLNKGGCSEVGCMVQAYDDAVKANHPDPLSTLRGGKMRTLRVASEMGARIDSATGTSRFTAWAVYRVSVVRRPWARRESSFDDDTGRPRQVFGRGAEGSV
jgi:hypothetical protein